MIKPNINLFLNNNPSCYTKLENIAKKQVWNMKNKPYIYIDGIGFENGSKRLKVIFKGQIIFNDKIDIIDNYFELKITLQRPLNNPNEIIVDIDDVEYNIDINLKKLYGNVKYFNGQPVKNPVISVTKEDIVTIGDERGNYEIYLSENVKQIGIFEKNYSKETLEAWIYNINIEEDCNLEIQIDQMEVYGIHMWDGQVSDYIHFTPMSLNRTKKGIKDNLGNELDLLKDKNIWPKLNEESIRIFADNEPLEILSITEVPDFLGEIEKERYYRSSYILSIPKGNKGKVIKIQIQHIININNNEIVEKGEGYYIWN
ncbi:hypothetical protein [Senegalia massiliensis]|uniref:hypothetical protein n=1 Tax=Senegalia massiliensis TaxID=1720316 RepID=UPI001031C04B|nr:hypothetical protein [Senegalia massiliensis]